MDNTLIFAGNVTREPELRFTPGGQAVTKFGLAVNRRWSNRQTGEFDEAVTFIDVISWGDLAEHCADSLHKGLRVIVLGRLDQRSFESRTGEKRTVFEVTASDIGPSLKWVSADVQKAARKYGSKEPSADELVEGSKDSYDDLTYADLEEPF